MDCYSLLLVYISIIAVCLVRQKSKFPNGANVGSLTFSVICHIYSFVCYSVKDITPRSADE